MKTQILKVLGTTLNTYQEIIKACVLLQQIDMRAPTAEKIMSTRATLYDAPLANRFIAVVSTDGQYHCLFGHQLFGSKSVHPDQDVVVTCISDQKNNTMPQKALEILLAIQQKTSTKSIDHALDLLYQDQDKIRAEGPSLTVAKSFRTNVFGSDEPVRDLSSALSTLGLKQRASSFYKKFENSVYGKEAKAKVAKPKHLKGKNQIKTKQQEVNEDIAREVPNEDAPFDDIEVNAEAPSFIDPFSDDKSFDEVDSCQNNSLTDEDIQQEETLDSILTDDNAAIAAKFQRLTAYPHYEQAQQNWQEINMKGKLTLRSMEYVFVVALLHNYPIPFEEMINKLALEDKWTCYHLIPVWLGENYLEIYTRDKIAEAEQWITTMVHQ